MNRVLENTFYYLENFQRVLDWIDARYSDLLNDEERSFIATFPTLTQPARALFVRMVMRKGSLFRASKLEYAEIGCTLAAAQQLLPSGWIATDPELALDELFELLAKPEIIHTFGAHLTNKGARKDQLREQLSPHYPQVQRYSDWCGDAADSALQIRVKPLCERLRLIFFGNLRQDWTEFVLSDLGVYRFEQVDLGPAARAFRRRSDIDHFLQLHACRERFAEALEPLETILADLPAPVTDNDWLAGRREKFLFQVGQQLEKQQDWEHAHAVYRDCAYPGARGRAMRVLEKAGRFAEAWDLCARAQAAPESAAEAQQLLRIVPRLARKLGHQVVRAPRAPAPAQLDLRLPHPGPQPWVEGAVRAHLASNDAPVFYVENLLANALFGLLCWRAIFAPVPGAFFHPFHRGPVDLYSPEFYARRASEFEACLARCDDGSYRQTILAQFDAKAGISSPFVVWEALTRELLELALDCIPAPHLQAWCRWILADVKANRCGFPDLIQFWPAERRYQMIEVKGPGDRLQDNQLRWIAYCSAQQMPVAVCYLEWEAA